MPEHIPWLVWRVVLRGFATLQEIETHYSLADLWIANEVLDLQDQADEQVRARQ